jgi:hypothetical protein
MNTYFSEIDDVALTLELTPTREQEKAEHSFIVKEGTVAFVLGVVRPTEEGFALATNVEVALFRNNDLIPREDNSATFVGDSLVSYIDSSPTPGVWKLEVRSHGNEPFVVSVGVLPKPLKWIRGFINIDRCKACKMSLRPIIFALLAKLTVGGVAALHVGNFTAALAHLADSALAVLHNATGLPIEWLKHLFGGVKDILGVETPWGWLAKRICEKLGFCSATASGGE